MNAGPLTAERQACDALAGEQWQRDALGRVTSLIDETSGTADQSFFDTAMMPGGRPVLGALGSSTSGDGIVDTYEYDAMARPFARSRLVDGRLLRFVTHLDDFGRELTTSYPDSLGLGVTTVQNYYDPGSGEPYEVRLNGSTVWRLEGAVVTQSYVSDAIGNLTDTHDGTIVYGDAARPYAATELDGPEGGHFAYDDVGNVYQAGELTITYTQRNLPRTISSSKVGLIEYRYDAEGVRATKRGRDVDVTYFGLYELERRGMQVYERLSIPTPVGVIAQLERRGVVPGDQTPAVRLRWLLAERQGSVETTWVSGEEPEHHRYDAYGGVLAESGATTGERPSPTVSQGYTGHEHEDEVGLVNMGGRMYSPRLRRFLSADPIVAVPYGQGLNAYSYVMGDPMNWTDRSGWYREQPGYQLPADLRDPRGPTGPYGPQCDDNGGTCVFTEPEAGTITETRPGDGSAEERTSAGAAGQGPAEASDGPVSGALAGALAAARSEIGSRQLPWVFLAKSGAIERALLTHYVQGRGAPLQLTYDQVGEVTRGELDPFERPRYAAATPNSFEQTILDLAAAGGGVLENHHAGSGANVNTLGQAGAAWEGRFEVSSDGTWTFDGTVSVTDYWDFDARPWGERRDASGSVRPEVMARLAGGALFGTPFPVTSVRIPAHMSSSARELSFGYQRGGRSGAPSVSSLAEGLPFVYAWGVPGALQTLMAGDALPHPNQGSP